MTSKKGKDDKRPDVDHEAQTPLLDFPDGDGDPNCEKCRGRGVTTKMVDAGGGVMWPGGTEICVCVYKRDLEANVKRIWPVLLNVESADNSPLLKLTNENLWITASGYDLRRHLRYTAYRKGTQWDARVVTDSKIITSWLSTTKYAHDPDVTVERERDPSSDEFMTIEDIAVPFDLLIIVLGVKAAKNREMPNVLLEAINEREMKGKPTWVVDSPARPLQEGHICYNDGVMEALDNFRRVRLTTGAPTRTGGFQQMGLTSGPPKVEDAPTHETRRSQRPQSIYTKRKPGMAAPRPAVPDVEPAPEPVRGRRPLQKPAGYKAQAPPPVTESYDDDDLSVDALLAGAVDAQPEGPAVYPEDDGPTDLVFDEDEDDGTVAEVTSYKPSPEELGQDSDMMQRAREAASKPKPRGRRPLRGAFSTKKGGGK